MSGVQARGRARRHHRRRQRHRRGGRAALRAKRGRRGRLRRHRRRDRAGDRRRVLGVRDGHAHVCDVADADAVMAARGAHRGRARPGRRPGQQRGRRHRRPVPGLGDRGLGRGCGRSTSTASPTAATRSAPGWSSAAAARSSTSPRAPRTSRTATWRPTARRRPPSSRCRSACARTGARHGVGVSVVCPGVIDTPIAVATRAIAGAMAARQARAERALGLGHSPDLVAKAIVDCVERNRDVVPVGIESTLAYKLLRGAPAADPGPRRAGRRL